MWRPTFRSASTNTDGERTALLEGSHERPTHRHARGSRVISRRPAGECAAGAALAAGRCEPEDICAAALARRPAGHPRPLAHRARGVLQHTGPEPAGPG